MPGHQCQLLQCQDAHLDATIIVDEESVHTVAKEVNLWHSFIVSDKNQFNRLSLHGTLLQLVELKRRSVDLQWDFTFNLRLKQYPGDTEDWFQTERWLCSKACFFRYS